MWGINNIVQYICQELLNVHYMEKSLQLMKQLKLGMLNERQTTPILIGDALSVQSLFALTLPVLMVALTFRAAQVLWDDPDYILIPTKVVDEARFLIIGKIGEKHWSGIITYRDEQIRIISVRRSRKEEIDIYEG